MKRDARRILTGNAEKIPKLGLPYRVMLPAITLRLPAPPKPADLEVWLATNTHRNTLSCSRGIPWRMGAQFPRTPPAKSPAYFNGSPAVGRTLVAAIPRTTRTPDGSITVPVALRGYMGGLEVIR